MACGCSDDGLDEFAVKASMDAPVVLMRQDSSGKREVSGRYCCGKLLLPSSNTCSNCGEELLVTPSLEDAATMCRETWEDAVCCKIPITFEQRSCKKCGKYFPTALEIAKQAALKVEYRINLKKRLTTINNHFFKFMYQHLKKDDYSYEFIGCYNAFSKVNHSWKGFPARLVFDDNIVKTGVVILTQGMAGLGNNPRDFFPEGTIDDHRRFFV